MAYDRAEDYMANSSQLHASHDDSEDLTINASQFKQTQVQYATINGYRIGKCIGAGGFSKVFQAFNSEAVGQSPVAACKVISLQPPSAPDQHAAPDWKELQKEVQVHKVLKNRYVLEFIDSKVVKPDTVEAGVVFVPGLYMLLELALGGDLFDKIAPDVGIAEDLAKHYFQQLCSGLEYIHDKGICHRDLKPENLLLSADGDIKISDFGLCAVWKHKGKTRLLSGRCGSLPYVAPELNRPEQYEAVPVDMWGAGVVLFTLLVGNTPWDEPSTNSPEFAAYLTGELLQYSPWSNITGHSRTLLLGLLNVDPTARLTMQQVKRHPWFMRPSQVQRHEIPRMLTQGMRDAGMMDMILPPVNSQARRLGTQGSQALKSQQYSQISSQFMIEAALTSTIGGTVRNYNTLSRFWLHLSPEETYKILSDVFAEAAKSGNFLYGPDENAERGTMGWRLSLLDNRKQPLVGRVVLEREEGPDNDITLVKLERSKGDPLSWKRFWWSLTKHANLRERILVSNSQAR